MIIKNNKSATEEVNYVINELEKKVYNPGSQTGPKATDYKYNNINIPVRGSNLQINIKPQEEATINATKSIDTLFYKQVASDVGGAVETATQTTFTATLIMDGGTPQGVTIEPSNTAFKAGDRLIAGTGWESFEINEGDYLSTAVTLERDSKIESSEEYIVNKGTVCFIVTIGNPEDGASRFYFAYRDNTFIYGGYGYGKYALAVVTTENDGILVQDFNWNDISALPETDATITGWIFSNYANKDVSGYTWENNEYIETTKANGQFEAYELGWVHKQEIEVEDVTNLVFNGKLADGKGMGETITIDGDKHQLYHSNIISKNGSAGSEYVTLWDANEGTDNAPEWHLGYYSVT